jgi:predicted MFS family arabinose efflux permease
MSPTPASPHASPTAVRGLLIACGLALGMAVANGLARFAYALILPAMRSDLQWSYTEAGSLNTINAVGYLLGSWVAFRTVRKWGPTAPFIAGLWLTSILVLATGAVRDFEIISALRFLAGITTAYVFITGSVLAASVFPGDARRSASAIAIYFGGGGAGLLLSAIVLPWLFAKGGDGAWPQAWFALGVMSLIASAIATLAARPILPPPTQHAPHPWAKAPLAAMFVAYGCFALGYFAYMTFIVAWMREHGLSPAEIAAVWAVLGITTLLAPRIWSHAIATWKGGRALAAVMATIGIGAGLPTLFTSLSAMLVSAALFGIFFMTPAAVTTFVRRSLPAQVWGEAVAAFTLLFSVLQCAGPIVTGALADATGTLAAGLAASALLLLAGAAIALLQRERPAPLATSAGTT